MSAIRKLLMFVCAFCVYAGAQVTFTHTSQSISALAAPQSIASGDFNRDGNVDFVIAYNATSCCTSTIVYFTDGKGNVTSSTPLPAQYGGPTAVAVTDVNADGNPDIVEFLSNGHVWIYTNDGKGNFTFAADISTSNSQVNEYGGIARDFNGDGYGDFIVEECGSQATCNYLVYRNNHNLTFTQTQIIVATCPYYCYNSPPAVADFNQDGKLDLAIADGKVGVLMWLGNGDATFTQAPSVAASNVTQVDTADFNNDSKPDLVVETQNIYNPPITPQFTIYLNNGSAAFAAAGTVSGPPSSVNTRVWTGDINGDGNQDVLWVQEDTNGQGSGHIEYALGNGSGGLSGPYGVAETAYPGVIEVRDVTHDGRNDIIAGTFPNNNIGGAVDVLINQSATFRCNTPSSASDNASFCNPTPGSNVQSPFTLQVGTNSPFKIVRTEAWINGVKQAQSLSDQLSANISLPNGSYTLTVVAVDSAGNYAKSSIPFTVTSTQGQCSTPTQNQINICQPAQGATVSSPVTFLAATNTNFFTLNRVYVDNQPVYQTTSQQVNTSLTLSPGAHTIVLVSYNNNGGAITASRNVTISGGTGCATPGVDQVNICSPAQNANVTSPVQFTAATNTANFTLNRIYVDNVATYQVASQQVSTQLNLSLGNHYIVLVSYNSTGGAFSASRNITVH